MSLDLDLDERESPARLKAIYELVERNANQGKGTDEPYKGRKLKAKPLKSEDPTLRIYMVEYPVSPMYRSIDLLLTSVRVSVETGQTLLDVGAPTRKGTQRQESRRCIDIISFHAHCSYGVDARIWIE